MAVDQTPGSEDMTCFMTVEIEKHIPPVRKLQPELQTVDARNP